jgi:murein DD-endopeptidase MepM/ murein hydrolase activator NlpD
VSLHAGAILADAGVMKRAAVFLALMAAGCATGSPAPIAYGGGGDRSGPPAAPRVERREVAREDPPARAPAVQEAADWADGEGTPLSAYALQPEDAQPFDPARLPRTHRVGADESLYDIAARYQTPLRALIDQNNLEPPYALSPGRELRLPPPRFHTVARGESFEDVARRYNVDLRSLALLNRMQAPYRVRQGDRVVLPAMARAAPAPAPALNASNAASTPALPALPARFVMPLDGDIVARFGAQPGGGRVDGIEIAGREGAAIRAAADGDVVYAGSDLEAYGTLVLVRHADNYVTAYGHARRALVREGQRVRAGQEVAELGPRTDGRPRLLFQVRQGSAALDPAPLLGR